MFITPEDYEAYYVKTLDETAATAPSSATDVKVVFNRTMIPNVVVDNDKGINTENAWNTICFPFDLTEQQIKDLFGTNVVVKELDDATPVGDSFSLKFKAVTSIEANKPYIMQIKASDNKANNVYYIRGMDLVPDLSNNLTVTKGGIQFVGNYIYPCVMTNTNGTDYYILNDVFKSSTSRTKIKGFRAYFHVPSSLGVKGLCFGEDDTTGILEISDYMFTSPVNIYSVGGQLLRKHATNMDDLPKGTYIVNGKKIFKSK